MTFHPDEQLKKLRMHPDVPSDFLWKEYLRINHDLLRKGHTSEYQALRHYIKIGKKSGLSYKEEGIRTAEKDHSINIDENSLRKSQKSAVYTCIAGNYDSVKCILKKDPSWDYICFVDDYTDAVSIDGWTFRKIPSSLEKLDPTRKARAIKVLPHVFLPEYKETIWVDGSIEILEEPSNFIKDFFLEKEIFAIPKHPDRTCIYQESLACIKFKKDEERVLQTQVDDYRKEGYPENWGLVQSQIIYRKNVRKVRRLCDLWWNEILNKSKRDQMSFNYVFWKRPIQIKILPPSLCVSSYFHLWTHREGTHKKASIRKNYDSIINYINGRPV